MPPGVYKHHSHQGYQKGHTINLGRKFGPQSEEHKKKLREAKLKNPVRYWLGKKRPEVLNWLTPFEKGMIPWNKGKECLKTSGKNNWRWIEDRTKVKGYWSERNNPEYKQWVKKVKKRDKGQCKINNKDCSGYCIVHHIKGWKQYPELKYKINNGITLCQAHHPRKRAEEKRLIPFFQGLVPVSSE